ncbi:uncharacterized protein PITG_16690 [Phytophthora infestans T30-4]|uniref:Uncharacterized protein n=1 Tax=Phytophthora infestans (strain T30-4) TaxID=403677 RepID=D0NVE2_PHYIT|nr:uncharacterized protein PITG_16690 [Phytophthora infestans T30-4]EEY66619.1 hypothetical protein PITG_16690 [Phytophthora infestans T30-4]|eukprot:XP_002896920.1 hypothetical protein PITG_16690 [Phytophthora infestans T30-4]
MLASQGQQDENDDFDEPVVSSAPELSDEVDKLSYKCKARKYSPEVKAFMEGLNAKLEGLGWIYENTIRAAVVNDSPEDLHAKGSSARVLRCGFIFPSND